MIQIFEVKAPLGKLDGAAAVATLVSAADKVKATFPALLDTTPTVGPQNVLTLRLRVSGRTRWHASAIARKIASSMLWRLKVPTAEAVMNLVLTPPSGNSLTKEQGRSTSNHRPRRSKAQIRVDSQAAPEDPS